MKAFINFILIPSERERSGQSLSKRIKSSRTGEQLAVISPLEMEQSFRFHHTCLYEIEGRRLLENLREDNQYHKWPNGRALELDHG